MQSGRKVIIAAPVISVGTGVDVLHIHLVEIRQQGHGVFENLNITTMKSDIIFFFYVVII